MVATVAITIIIITTITVAVTYGQFPSHYCCRILHHQHQHRIRTGCLGSLNCGFGESES